MNKQRVADNIVQAIVKEVNHSSTKEYEGGCKTLVIDAMNLAYRFYYGMPRLTTSDGNVSSVVYGFLLKINSLYNMFQPENLIICWDSKSNIRKAIDSTYKVREKEENAELEAYRDQIKSLKDIFPMIGIPSIEVPDYESDDIMAILARREDLKPLVLCTNDSDLYQCLNPGTNMYNDTELITEAFLLDKHGLTPRQYTIYKSIVGCTTDNVKGIKGYGKVAAKKIINNCGGQIGAIYHHIASLGPVYEEFINSLLLIVLPYNMGYSLPIDPIPQLNLNSKVIDFLARYEINVIDPNKFLGGING